MMKKTEGFDLEKVVCFTTSNNFQERTKCNNCGRGYLTFRFSEQGKYENKSFYRVKIEGLKTPKTICGFCLGLPADRDLVRESPKFKWRL